MTEILMTKRNSLENLNIRILRRCSGQVLDLFRISKLVLVKTGIRISDLNILPPSSSGLGYQVLILETGVRLPLGVVFIDY